jgi:hypothetical protein
MKGYTIHVRRHVRKGWVAEFAGRIYGPTVLAHEALDLVGRELLSVESAAFRERLGVAEGDA